MAVVDEDYVLIPVVLVALCAIAVARGGRIIRLSALNWHWPILVIVGIGLQEIATIFLSRHSGGIKPQWFYLAGWYVLVAFLVINIHRAPLKTLASGAALNLLVIFANHGTMPMSAWAHRVSGVHDKVGVWYNSMVLVHPRLLMLGDALPIPKFFGPLASPFSIGDLIICVGFVRLFWQTVFDESLDANLKLPKYFAKNN